jgi:hypothetical protein
MRVCVRARWVGVADCEPSDDVYAQSARPTAADAGRGELIESVRAVAGDEPRPTIMTMIPHNTVRQTLEVTRARG